MRSFRTSCLRRLTAAAFAVGFAVFMGEQLVADVHDGHAAVSAEATVAAIPSAASPAIGSPAEHPNAPAGHRREPGGSHTIHVCHDAHAHSVPPAEAPKLALLDGPRDDVPRSAAATLTSRELEPQLRPPIG